MVTSEKRGMMVESVCPRCGEESKTMAHMALSRKENHLLWKISPLRLECTQDINSFQEWCLSFPEANKEKIASEILMMVVWQIWNMRNLWLFEKKKIDARLLCERTIRFYEKANEINARNGPSLAILETQTEHGWQAPDTNRGKLNNVDTDVKEGKMGFGMVVRDHLGDVNMATKGCVRDEGPVIKVEAMVVAF